jgi:23S rRNA pseudouridine1911/1915/1917 synthase
MEKTKTIYPHSNTPTLQRSMPPYSGPPVRLDRWLSSHKPDLSRARWQELIKTGHVRVNNQVKKPHYELRANDVVETEIPPPEPTELVAQEIPLNVLFEDADILVLNKPAGLVVHPAPGHSSGTLVNALLYRCKDLPGIGGDLRPGIVHRLDRDTSGVLVIAKNDCAMAGLAAQFQSRKVQKQYAALVWGRPVPDRGTIQTLVGRNPHNRKKMSVRTASGRAAITHYHTIQKFAEASLLRVRIETGRTHQIRVHLAHIGHPVVGDAQYGRARKTKRSLPANRQMLHAEYLAFAHPRTGLPLEFHAPIPEDMSSLLKRLADGEDNPPGHP